MRTALVEPTDDGEAFAAGDGRDLVHGVGAEGDQQAGLPRYGEDERPSPRLFVRAVDEQLAPAVCLLGRPGRAPVQKYDHRDLTNLQVVELDLFGVTVLMPDEEVPFPVAQELRRLAARQAQTEVAPDLLTQLAEPSLYVGGGRGRYFETARLPHVLMHVPFGAFDVDGGGVA